MSHPYTGWSPEDDRPLPELPFWRKVAEDLWEGYFTLLVWSFFMWLISILRTMAGIFFAPLELLVAIFTVGPLMTGLMVASGKAAQGGFNRLGDAARGTVRLYWRSVALALPLVIFGALILFTAKLVSDFPERQEMVPAWVLQIGISLTLAILHIYLLPLLALYETPFKRTVQWAMALVVKSIWRTLALMVLGAGLLALTFIHPLIWVLVPGLWCVVVVNATWRMTKDQSSLS